MSRYPWEKLAQHGDSRRRRHELHSWGPTRILLQMNAYPPPTSATADPLGDRGAQVTDRPAARRWPSSALRTVCVIWALVLGVAAGTGAGPRRWLLFQLAAWPPVLVMLAPLIPRRPRPYWLLMTGGVLSFLLATSLESFTRYKALTAPEDLGLADPLFLVGYALFFAGIALMVSQHGRRAIGEGLTDMVIVLVPAVVLLIEYVVVPGPSTAPWYERLTVGIYPLLDVVMVAAIVWLIAAPALSRRHLGALLTGAVMLLALDFLLAAEMFEPDSVARRVLEDLYPVTYAVLAIGVAVGATTRLGMTDRATMVHWGRVWVLALGAMMGPLMVAVASMGANKLPVGWVALAALVSVGLIVRRMVALTRTLQILTDQLAAARLDLQRQATHDPLTGLWNRAMLDEALAILADPDNRPSALLSIDLDRFKAVNDRHGHAAGDEVLQVAAVRMRSTVRDDDRVLRVGGDEFLVVLVHVVPSEATALARRLVRALEQPVRWNSEDLAISASVGVAIAGRGSSQVDVSELIAGADAAMYTAKRAGSGSVVLAGPGAPGVAEHPPATVGDHDDDPDRVGDCTSDPQR